jgi:hypothetical protein
MMKNKKQNLVHPKSYPVPPSAPSQSRNPLGTAMLKGGTLQTQSKQKVTRVTKSPPGLPKKSLDGPLQSYLKPGTALSGAIKPTPAQKLNVGPRAIKTEQNKVLKKSLSNNDIQILPNKSDAPKPISAASNAANARSQIKRHSPSPTQTQTGKPKSPSPLRPTSSAKQPMKPAAKMVATKGKVSEPHTKSASNTVPWADFVYHLRNNKIERRRKF